MTDREFIQAGGGEEVSDAGHGECTSCGGFGVCEDDEGELTDGTCQTCSGAGVVPVCDACGWAPCVCDYDEEDAP